jgi:hypothetical protein
MDLLVEQILVEYLSMVERDLKVAEVADLMARRYYLHHWMVY